MPIRGLALFFLAACAPARLSVDELIAQQRMRQQCPGVERGIVTGVVSDPRLPEISGAVLSRLHPDTLWVVNDSGNAPELFALSATGTVKAVYRVEGAEAFDWEALAYFRQGETGVIFIADTGDNFHIRRHGTIYEVDEPKTLAPTGTLRVRAQTPLVYAGGHENVEAFAVDPSSGDFFFATRGDGGPIVLYRHARGAEASVSVRLASVSLGDGRRGEGLSTGADFDAAGRRFVLRTYTAAYLWIRDDAASWEDAFKRLPCKLVLERERQGESIALDERGFFTLSEGVGEPIWHYRWK